MRVSRLYVAMPLDASETVRFDEEAAHYIRTVLRLKKGQQIELFNGDGCNYPAILLEVSRHQVSAQITGKLAHDAESPLSIHLGLGISRGDRMDFAVQKAVELGVQQITPLLTERCVVQFKDEKKPQRWIHWQKIIQHACEQCGRTVIPGFQEIEAMSTWLDKPDGLRLFLDPYAQTNLVKLTPVESRVSLLIGPEGGFSELERTHAIAAGFTPVRLGKRILRTETAVLAAISAVQMLWGDFGK